MLAASTITSSSKKAKKRELRRRGGAKPPNTAEAAAASSRPLAAKTIINSQGDDHTDDNRPHISASFSTSSSKLSKISFLSFLAGLLAIGILVANGNINSQNIKETIDQGVVNVKVFGSNFVLPDFQGVQNQLSFDNVQKLADAVRESFEESKTALKSHWQAIWDQGGLGENPNDDSEDYTDDLNAWIQHKNEGVAPASDEASTEGAVESQGKPPPFKEAPTSAAIAELEEAPEKLATDEELTINPDVTSGHSHGTTKNNDSVPVNDIDFNEPGNL